MSRSVIFAALAAAGLLATTGCCGSPCGDCGWYPGKAVASGIGGCRGCGPLYWNEFYNDPPEPCDPCDCNGHFTGRGCNGGGCSTGCNSCGCGGGCGTIGWSNWGWGSWCGGGGQCGGGHASSCGCGGGGGDGGMSMGNGEVYDEDGGVPTSAMRVRQEPTPATAKRPTGQRTTQRIQQRRVRPVSHTEPIDQASDEPVRQATIRQIDPPVRASNYTSGTPCTTCRR